MCESGRKLIVGNQKCTCLQSLAQDVTGIKDEAVPFVAGSQTCEPYNVLKDDCNYLASNRKLRRHHAHPEELLNLQGPYVRINNSLFKSWTDMLYSSMVAGNLPSHLEILSTGQNYYEILVKHIQACHAAISHTLLMT